ncbi:DUF1254 domain-containing protein [Candidatus Uhrbacteria bacterium]|nr:DUF1254 domain-containing protein [Candidatus Uhrbacteria bacterium]
MFFPGLDHDDERTAPVRFRRASSSLHVSVATELPPEQSAFDPRKAFPPAVLEKFAIRLDANGRDQHGLAWESGAYGWGDPWIASLRTIIAALLANPKEIEKELWQAFLESVRDPLIAYIALGRGEHENPKQRIALTRDYFLAVIRRAMEILPSMISQRLQQLENGKKGQSTISQKTVAEHVEFVNRQHEKYGVRSAATGLIYAHMMRSFKFVTLLFVKRLQLAVRKGGRLAAILGAAVKQLFDGVDVDLGMPITPVNIDTFLAVHERLIDESQPLLLQADASFLADLDFARRRAAANTLRVTADKQSVSRALLLDKLPEKTRRSLDLETAEQEMEAHSIGKQAAAYGFPLVEMMKTRRKRNVGTENADSKQPNQLEHAREPRNPAHRDVVRPNCDTLYSGSWLDLSDGPVVLSVPETGGRYWNFQIMDFHSHTVACPGVQTKGGSAYSCVIVGPDWKGGVPVGMERIDCPTNAAWLLGRFGFTDDADLPAAHAVQNQCTLTPLNPVAVTRKQYDAPAAGEDPLNFFVDLAKVLRENPPPDADAELMERLAKIGIGPDRIFDPAMVDPITRRGLERAYREAMKAIDEGALLRKHSVNGWSSPAGDAASFGGNYLLRAETARHMLAALPREEAMYFERTTDDNGEALRGDRRYVLIFPDGQRPPADGFWSVTMYDADHFLVENPVNRYSVGDRSPGLHKGEKGPYQIFIHHVAPGDAPGPHVLPAPQGEFSLVLRLFLPQAQAMDGTWQPPVVKRIA